MSTKSNLFFSLTVLLCISCSQKDSEMAMKLTADAGKIAYDFKLDSVKRQDSALALFDKAIAYDSDYVGAYLGKNYVLTSKHDLKALLENNEQIVRLRPEQPMWKIQRGLLLEISGNKKAASEMYKTGLQQYKDIFKEKPELRQDVNFRIEYISALQLAVNDAAGKKEFDLLKAEFPDNELVKSIPFISRSKVMELWQHPEKAEEIVTPQGL